MADTSSGLSNGSGGAGTAKASSGKQNDLFSNAAICSYAGITIPVHSFQIYSGSQVAWHKYPYRPGADAEYTGREQTTGQIVAPFYVGMITHGVQSQNVLWPGNVAKLRDAAQTQKSQALVLPAGLGTIPKAVIKVNESYIATARDGAMVTIQFWEDNSTALSVLPLPSAVGSLPQQAQTLDNMFKLAPIPTPQLFTDSGGNVIASWFGAINTILANLQVIEDNLSLPVQQANLTLGAISTILQQPGSLKSTSEWPIYQQLVIVHDNLSNAIFQILNARQIGIYSTKVDTNIVAIATATKCSPADLIKLNNVPDWNVVPQGSDINYYLPS
jgi:hypothetical protein